MNYNKIKTILENLSKIACNNFIPWLCCAVFMIPALPVSSIFISIMENTIMLEKQISSFMGMVLFMLISFFPIFLIPQHECSKRKRR
jgi:hypothetical protein